MTYQLRIEPIGETIEVAVGQTILDACLRQGIYLPYACGHGLCSTCKIDLLEGELDHGEASPFALMDVERQEGKALACVATLRSNAAVVAEVDEEEDALRLPVGDHSGLVVSRRLITSDILELVIEISGGLRFQAGQYVNLRVPGIDRPRAFSIASSPHQPERIELHVKLVPGGAATTHLHERVEVGARLEMTGPFGRFFVRRSAGKPILLLAGGSGLSAIRSMLLDLEADRPDATVHLFHAVHDESDLCLTSELRALAARWPELNYVPSISSPSPSYEWAGERGRAEEVLARTFQGKLAGHTAYVCGPPPMIEACIRVLMQGRLFERDIYTEKFLTAADAGQASARSPLFKRI